ncbi:Os10g0453350 [Oryza sativa Japonica Group]|uniref:Os10g0453350 protein n=1 Tax=Oryza sativa subsp. japonica TaxID=39947 RepID=A0A0P0XVK1_ORYSJ|nr:Os10g0453350 [Oryza sativa Japonica Group]
MRWRRRKWSTVKGEAAVAGSVPHNLVEAGSGGWRCRGGGGSGRQSGERSRWRDPRLTVRWRRRKRPAVGGEATMAGSGGWRCGGGGGGSGQRSGERPRWPDPRLVGQILRPTIGRRGGVSGRRLGGGPQPDL